MASNKIDRSMIVDKVEDLIKAFHTEAVALVRDPLEHEEEVDQITEAAIRTAAGLLCEATGPRS